MLQPNDIAALVIHILETHDNLLVDEMSLWPLIPNPPQ
jgi:NADP-dependent 3-hydroxy acid dehydrogenase YdfG